ncbi:MAG TPA: RIP metalloprotease RseP, partial [bacterium]|nr:RIP metalloprotease RseP [bacterium]
TAGDPFAQPGDRLNDKPVPHRLLVAVAGAAMNAIVAVLLTIGLAYFGINVDPYLVQPPVIAHVQADSPADAAGLTAGDRILTINTTRVNTWEDAQTQIAMGISEPMILTVQRNEQTVSVEMSAPPEQLIELGGISPPSRVFVGKVTADSPAENAGLEHGDQIVSIDGNIIGSTLELMDRISGSEGKPIQIELLRDGQTLKRTLSPKYNDDEKRYLIGIQFGSDPDQVLRRYPLNEAISKGIDINIQMGRLMFTIFKRLLTGQESVRNMGGPVMIVDMAGKAAKSGVRDLIWLTALISLNLAILNLLPIPILDGGMVIFLLIEWLIRRPVSEKIQIALQNLFFFLLISFALYITYIDVLRIDWLSWFK